MKTDRYDNPLSTSSNAARDAYIRGVDLFLGANIGAEEAFAEAIAADDGFALAHIGLARTLHVYSKGAKAREALGKARAVSSGILPQEQGHIETLGRLIEGDSAGGYAAARAHLLVYPRDAMVAQTCLGVFGLIGFSGLPGREAEVLAFSETLAPHYGDDWWFLSALSFSQSEVGQIGPATKSIERALGLNPRNANGAHHRAHLYYEVGETEAGYAYLDDWRQGYDRCALMHCHLSWHIALWALARGDTDTMWRVIDTDIDPRVSDGPPINVVTDMAAILYRAELAGVEVSNQRWQSISEYASARFSRPGIAFVDVHAALAHAMAGNSDALQKIMSDAKGPAADIVAVLAEAFAAIVSGDWQTAAGHLTKAMSDHARIGGSRAQRDLIDYAMASVLLRLGQSDEARRMLQIRRPLAASGVAVAGL